MKSIESISPAKKNKLREQDHESSVAEVCLYFLNDWVCVHKCEMQERREMRRQSE